MLVFVLTMPNIGSWNGHWSGEDDFHCKVVRTSKKKEEELAGKSFYYNFGDGWGAMISVSSMPSYEANKFKKKSKGFSGYDWMVDSILEYGEILNSSERVRFIRNKEDTNKYKNDTTNKGRSQESGARIN